MKPRQLSPTNCLTSRTVILPQRALLDLPELPFRSIHCCASLRPLFTGSANSGPIESGSNLLGSHWLWPLLSSKPIHRRERERQATSQDCSLEVAAGGSSVSTRILRGEWTLCLTSLGKWRSLPVQLWSLERSSRLRFAETQQRVHQESRPRPFLAACD